MKLSAKSVLPEALLVFLTAAALFFAFGLRNGPGISDLIAGRHEEQLSAWAVLAPDGTLKYVASRNPDECWEFDEMLRSQKKIPAPSHVRGEQTVYLGAVSHASVQRHGEYTRQIAYGGETASPPSSLEWPLVWWNGPEAWFDVYSRYTRLRIGSIGGDGVFVDAPAIPSARFQLSQIADNVSGACFIATESGVYRLDLPRGPLHPIFEGPVQAVSFTLPNPPEGFSRSYGSTSAVGEWSLFVESGGALLEMGPQGRVARRVPLPQEVVGLGGEITFFKNGRLLVETSDPQAWWVKRLRLLDGNGQALRQVEYDAQKTAQEMSKELPRSPIVITAPTILPPLPPLPGWMTPAALAQSAILSLLLAAIVLWQQLRIGRRGTGCAAWVFFVLLFGLLGAVAYVAAHWDKRTEPCPECGKRRPIAREACPHCAALWPKPAKSGFEVLEPR